MNDATAAAIMLSVVVISLTALGIVNKVYPSPAQTVCEAPHE